jgi:hypothetical protein
VSTEGALLLGEQTDVETDVDCLSTEVGWGVSTAAASWRSRRADRGGDAGGEGNEELERKAAKKRAAEAPAGAEEAPMLLLEHTDT